MNIFSNKNWLLVLGKHFGIYVVTCLTLSTIKPFVWFALLHFSELSLTLELLVDLEHIKQTRLNSNSQNSICLCFLVHMCVLSHWGKTNFLIFVSLVLNIFCFFPLSLCLKRKDNELHISKPSPLNIHPHMALNTIPLSIYCSLRDQHRPGFVFILASLQLFLKCEQISLSCP